MIDIATYSSFNSANEIDMKECSAYGQVIPQQAETVIEQPHVYESTM